MIAIEAGDTIIDCGYDEGHFITFLVRADNAAANLDCLRDRDFIQRDVTYQFRIAVTERILREQTGFYGVADSVLVQLLFQSWWDGSGTMQVVHGFAGGITHYHAVRVGQ